MREISPSHKKFIEFIVNGESQSVAYRLSIGKKGISKSVCEVKGCQLAKRYATEIAQERERRAMIIQAANDSAIVKDALKSVLTQAQVDAKLSAIINGEEQEVKQLNAQGKVFKAFVTPSILDRLKAIDLYNKRFGSNAPVKSDVALHSNEEIFVTISPIPPKTISGTNND